MNIFSSFRRYLGSIVNAIAPDSAASFLTHPGFKKYFKNTGWLFSGRLLTLAVSFFVGAYVARYLGPERYGILNYAVSFVGLFAFVSSFGIDNILGREILRHSDRTASVLGTSFLIKALGGFLVMLLATAASFLANPRDSQMHLFVIIYSATFVFQAFGTIESYFQSNVSAKKVVRVQVAVGVILALLKIFFIYQGYGIVWFVSVYLMETIFLAFGYVVAYMASGGSMKRWHFDKSFAKEMLSDSWPLIFMNAFYYLYMRIDQVMIRNMMGDGPLGLYSVAVRLSEIWMFIPTLLCTSLFPAIMNAKSVDNKLYEKRMKNFYLLITLLSFAVASLFAIFAKIIIQILFGAAYSGSIPVLQTYVWSGVFSAIGMIVFQYLIVENYTKILSLIALVGGITNVVLNLALIPIYGIMGAAFATVISYLFVILSLSFFKNTRGHLTLIAKSFL